MRIFDKVEDCVKETISCRTRKLRRREAEEKKNEFRKEFGNLVTAEPGEEGKNVVSVVSTSSTLPKIRDSVTIKPGGKKKIYSINGNVRV